MSVAVRFFAGIGLTVAIMAAAGAMGVGHFRAYYGPEDVKCVAAALKGDPRE